MVDILHISNFELEDGWKRRIFRPIRPVARLTRFHWLSTLSEKKTAKTPGKTTIHDTAVQRAPLDLQLLARLVLMRASLLFTEKCTSSYLIERCGSGVCRHRTTHQLR